jgi:uncharacterized phage protein gp47/JayE
VAYEDKTVEALTDDILANVDDEFDKREGSVAYDLTVPYAIELSLLYTELASTLLLGFADTTEGSYLDLRAGEIGLTRKEAVKSVGSLTLTGPEGTFVPEGTRAVTDSMTPVYFLTTQEGTITGGTLTVTAEAETAGAAGNVTAGAVVSLAEGDPLLGILTATNAAAFDGGADSEADADLLGRYYDKIRKPATSGNANSYLQWAKEVDGIGDAKVYPTWNGPGTVKVVLLDMDKTAPPQSLVDAAQAYIESERPIGATVTVVGAEEIAINITADVTLTAGKTVDDAVTEVTTTVTAYLTSMAFVDTTVRYTQIGSYILNANSVVDYSNLTIEGGTTNVTLQDGQVAVLGTVTFNVA